MKRLILFKPDLCTQITFCDDPMDKWIRFVWDLDIPINPANDDLAIMAGIRYEDEDVCE